MLSYDEILEKVLSSTGFTKKKAEELVKKKVDELGGTVSRTGALLVVARENNVDLNFRPVAREMKISELDAGMGGVSFFGKFASIFPVNEFNTSKGQGRVQNVVLFDESGRIRMSFWNDEIDNVSKFKVGDVVLVSNPWLVNDNRGGIEARLGRGGKIELSDKKIEGDVTVAAPAKAGLEGIEAGDVVTFEGTVVEVNDRPLIYDFCPECRERLYGNECSRHGNVAPDRMLIVSTVMDDGNQSIGVVFFREVAERLLGKNVRKVAEEIDEGKDASAVASSAVSKRFRVNGRVRKSRFNDELEITANDVDPL